MHYYAFAVDYDGTLALDGRVHEDTVAALKRLRKSGRRVILVTGRTLEPLLEAFPEIGICDLVVAENGALIYDPDTKMERTIGEPPPAEFIETLAHRGVPALETGRVIVATWSPHETAVLETIREQALELQIIFNKGAVMVLPTGLNKAIGLAAALEELGLSPHNTVGVGDAENDVAFLKLCDASAAVANALSPVKERVDIVLDADHGAGVVELIDRVLKDDLADLPDRAGRGLLLGIDTRGEELRIPVYHTRVLVTGDSGGGKSKFAVSMLEQLIEQEYQTCVIDPEGDYQDLTGAIVLGTREQTPAVEEVLQVFEDPDKSCVVSLFAAEAKDQPPLFASLVQALMDHRSKTGRPHWYLIDEAHYPLPATWEPLGELPLKDFRSVMYVTAFPDRLAPAVLENIDLFVAIADNPAETVREYARQIGETPPDIDPPSDNAEHHALAWWRSRQAVIWFERLPLKGEHQRHLHSYLDGDMDPEYRFYFRGPNGELNLAAQNLRIFMQLGEGVDDETWLHHLKRGDYAEWFDKVIKDQELANLATKLASNGEPLASASRRELFDYIQKRYERDA